MNELLSAEADASWENIAPHLDAALGELAEAARDALLLRYFEKKSAPEMGKLLGISDEAAQKRVSRAVDRLREFLTKRGVTVGTSGLVVLISSHAVLVAPAGLQAAILAGAIGSTAIVAAATKIVAMTTLQKTAVAAVLAAAVGVGIYEAHQASVLRNKVNALQQQQARLAEQLIDERNLAARRFSNMSMDLDQAQRNLGELLRLRNEVGQLREQARSQRTGQAMTPVQLAAGRGRELASAVLNREPGAWEKLYALCDEQLRASFAEPAGLDEAKRMEFQEVTLAAPRAALEVIGAAATNGNKMALSVAAACVRSGDAMKYFAIPAFGPLAAGGDDELLEILLNPDIPPHHAAHALNLAARNGNQKAVDALCIIAKDTSNEGVRYMAADGLAFAAELGNAVAIEALIGLSSSTNQNVHKSIARGLKQSAANQNAKATEALRLIGAQ